MNQLLEDWANAVNSAVTSMTSATGTLKSLAQRAGDALDNNDVAAARGLIMELNNATSVLNETLVSLAGPNRVFVQAAGTATGHS